MSPKISIITICYNSEKHIEETIKSVISQDYQNLEYIIIDGGSKDNTMNIINKYRDKISKVISEPDEGISDAFNKGIKLASGDLIGIVNSDDLLMPGAAAEIADQYDGISDIVRGNQLIYNPETGMEYILSPSRKFKRYPMGFHVCHMATYISKKAFEKYGLYRKDFRIAMDLEIVYRMNRKGAKIQYIDTVIGKFITGGVSTVDLKQKRKEVSNVRKICGGCALEVSAFRFVLFLKDCAKKMMGTGRTDKLLHNAKKTND